MKNKNPLKIFLLTILGAVTTYFSIRLSPGQADLITTILTTLVTAIAAATNTQKKDSNENN